MTDTSLIFTILARDKATATFDKLQGHAAIAGAAIGVALAAGIATAMQKSKSDALLAAQLGAGPKMAAEIGTASGDLYARGVVDSIETGNAAIRAAIQNGLVPGDAPAKAIDAVASKITNLGMVMEEDASRVSAAVSQMLRTGMAKSAEEAFDLITAATQKGLNKTGDLLDSLNEYPTVLRGIGINGRTAMGLVSQGLQAGARDSDKVVDALKEFSLRAVDGSKGTMEAFEALGLSASKIAPAIAAGGPKAAAALDQVLDKLRTMKGTVKGAQAVQKLFGGPGEDLGAALFALDVGKAGKALGKVGGAAERAGQAMEQSAGAKVEAFRRSLEMGLVTALAGAATWLTQNAGLVQALATVLGPIAAIIGIVVVATKIWTAVQTALNIAMMANPIGLIILAIIALIAIFALAWQNSETFRSIVTGVWDAVSAGIGAAVDWIKGAISWLGALPGLVGGWFSAAGAAAVNAWNALLDWIRGVPSAIMSGLGSLGSLLVGAGRDLIQGLVNGVRNMAGAVVDAAKGVVSGAINAAKALLGIASPSKVFKWIGGMTGKGLVKGLTGTLSEIKSAAKKMSDTVIKAWEQRRISRARASSLLTIVRDQNARLKDLAKQRDSIVARIADARKLADDAASKARGTAALSGLDFGGRAPSAGGIQARLTAKLSRIRRHADVVKQLAGRGLHKGLLRQVIEAGPDEGLALGLALLSADAGMLASINSAQKAIDTSATSLGMFSADALYDSGKQAGQGFLSGLMAQQKAIEGAMDRMAKSLVNRLRKALKIKSPSQVMAEAGVMTGRGFSGGVLSTIPAAGIAGERLAGAVVPAPRPAPVTVPAHRGAGAVPAIEISLTTDGADQEMLRFLRKLVRIKGRGNVQLAFGK